MDGRQALRRLVGLPTLAVDGLLGAAVAGVQLGLLALGASQGGPPAFRPLDPLGVALIVAQGAALTWRRRRPLATFVAVFVPNTLYYLLSYPPSGFDFGLGVAIWTLAAYASRPVSALGCGIVLATWLTQWLTGAGAYFRYARWPTILYLLFWASAFWAWGRSARRVRAAHAAELAAQAERLERDRELEAQRAVAAERARIARELHDVIAHHLSVMVIQAGPGRRRLDDDPEQTRAALAAVEAADGLQAIEETRRLRPDVVLMDVRMPVLDGLEATRRLAGPDVADPACVLILTTYDVDEYVFDALRAGACGFLLKHTPEGLVEAVRTVASGEGLIAPSVTRRLIAEFARAPTAPAPPADLDRLTDREREVLELVARGRSNAEIARELYVGQATVKTHVGRVLAKLGLRDRIDAVIYAYEAGLVRPARRKGPGRCWPAKLLGEIGAIGRFPSEHHFAAHISAGFTRTHQVEFPVDAGQRLRQGQVVNHPAVEQPPRFEAGVGSRPPRPHAGLGLRGDASNVIVIPAGRLRPVTVARAGRPFHPQWRGAGPCPISGTPTRTRSSRHLASSLPRPPAAMTIPRR